MHINDLTEQQRKPPTRWERLRAWFDDFMHYTDWVSVVFLGFIGVILISTIAFLVVYAMSPNLATLKKGEWECTLVDRDILIVGRTIIPTRECLRYERRS